MQTTVATHVRTRFLGPTNYRGARVKAMSITGQSVTLDWDHALNVGDNHRAAFVAMLAKLERVPDGPVYAADAFDDGYAFMCPVREA